MTHARKTRRVPETHKPVAEVDELTMIHRECRGH